MWDRLYTHLPQYYHSKSSSDRRKLVATAMLTTLFLFFILLNGVFTRSHHQRSEIDTRTGLPGCNLWQTSAFWCNSGFVNCLTPYGLLFGTQSSSSTVRFTIKYATASRFQPPQKLSAIVAAYCLLFFIFTTLTLSLVAMFPVVCLPCVLNQTSHQARIPKTVFT